MALNGCLKLYLAGAAGNDRCVRAARLVVATTEGEDGRALATDSRGACDTTWPPRATDRISPMAARRNSPWRKVAGPRSIYGFPERLNQPTRYREPCPDPLNDRSTPPGHDPLSISLPVLGFGFRRAGMVSVSCVANTFVTAEASIAVTKSSSPSAPASVVPFAQGAQMAILVNQ